MDNPKEKTGILCYKRSKLGRSTEMMIECSNTDEALCGHQQEKREGTF